MREGNSSVYYTKVPMKMLTEAKFIGTFVIVYAKTGLSSGRACQMPQAWLMYAYGGNYGETEDKDRGKNFIGAGTEYDSSQCRFGF